MNDSTDTRRHEAEAFLDALFADRTGHLRFALGHGGHFNGDGRYVFEKWHERMGQWPDCREKFIEDALRLSDEGVDVYVCPYLGTTPKREQGSAKPSRVLYADDAASPSHDDRWMVVDSGGGDADSFHVYALTTEDMESADLMSGNRRMKAATGGDSKVSDNDVLRLPGTRNGKTGNLVRLVQEGTPTPLEALELPADPGAAETRDVAAAPAEDFDVSKLPPTLRLRLNEEPNDDRSGQTFALIRDAQTARLDDETILAAVLKHRPTVERAKERYSDPLKARRWMLDDAKRILGKPGDVIDFPVLRNGDDAPPVESAFDGDLAGLLERTHGYFTRYVVAAEPIPTLVALWIAHTYVVEHGQVSGYPYFVSPEPGSGKTLALDVAGSVAYKGTGMGGLTAAVLFRVINKFSPTLLLDEIDTVFGPKPSDTSEAIRQVLNNGYRRGMPVWRTVGRNFEPTPFEVFGAKALAGLKPLPGSLDHRAFNFRMKPATDDEQREDFELDDVERLQEAASIRAALEGWAESVGDTLADPTRKPDRLRELDARQNEISRPLLRIADLAGGRWPVDARAGLVETLATGKVAQRMSNGRKLLRAARQAFDGNGAPVGSLFTATKLTCRELVQAINEAPDSEFAHWNDFKGITTREAGHILSAYGITANTVRSDRGGGRGEGYKRDQFEDAWKRYLVDEDEAEADDDGVVADW